MLRGGIRLEDSAYRFGGDEFAVLLPGASTGQAEMVLERVAEAASAAPFTWGVAACPDDGLTAEELVSAADLRLYARRRTCRGRR